MKIAVPCAGGALCPHFGHCEEFAIIETENGQIINTEMVEPPPHEPGVLPKWLAGKNVNLIIAGGMGMRAQQLFTGNNIKVVTGAPAESPEELTAKYLEGRLTTGDNLCDH